MTAEQLIRILEKLPDDQKQLPVVMSWRKVPWEVFGVGVVKGKWIYLDHEDHT